MLMQQAVPHYVEERLAVEVNDVRYPAVLTSPSGGDTLLARMSGPRSVVIAGHSEGAVVAGLLASEDARVQGVVSLSGPAVGLLSIMRGQLPPDRSGGDGLATFDAAVAALRKHQPLPPDAATNPSTAMLARMDAASLTYITSLVMFPTLQHFYKAVSPDADPMKSFGLDTESDPAVADAISSWMMVTFSKRP
jgi:pimeloyl-ACP methyl ester carboxylesterase